MTVWGEHGDRPSRSGLEISKQQEISSKRKSTVATAGTGIQVVAVLFAVRVGYKLARSASKLLFDHKLGCCAPQASESDQAEAQEFPNEAGDDDSSVTAEDQWVLCAEPVPEPPEGSKLMASEHMPISVYHFYEQFLSIETTCLQDHHKSTGQYSFRSTRWKDDGAGHFTRVLDFMQPKRGVCSVNAHCVQQQRFSVHAGGVFVLTSDMGMERIPYADCFRVQGFWKAAPDATGLGCNVSIHVAVPFSKRCLVKGLISGTTLKDCQAFYSDFLAKVQNSITTELLPAAAAQAAAAEQLLGTSPQAAAAAGRLHAPPPPRTAPPTPAAAPMVSPFAAVDAEVFVSTPLQAGGSAPQRKRSQQRGSGAKGVGGWLRIWPRRQQQPQQQQQQQQQQRVQEAMATPRQQGLAAGAQPAGSLLGPLQQQPSLQLLQAQHGGGQHVGRHQQQHGLHARSVSRCTTPGAGAAGLRHAGRAVSVKPSFALPIADLKLPNRPKQELLSTAQAILLLLVLLVQLLTLYDNMAIRRLLVATGPLEGRL